MEYLDDFIKTNAHLVKSTLSSYRTDIIQFFEYFNEDISSLNGEAIEEYFTHLLSKGFKPKTIARKLVSLRKFLIYLNTSGKVKNDAYTYIEVIRVQEDYYLDENKVLNSNEFKRLLSHAKAADDLRAVAIFKALAFSGVRISELLQFKGINYKTGEVTIRAKKRTFRTVPIHSEVIEAIDDYRRQRKHSDSDYIFLNQSNENRMSRQEIDKIIKYYSGKAKIKRTKAHAHSFRHMAGINLIDELGIDGVATFLGHSNVNTSRIYAQRSKSEIKRKTDNALNRAYA